VSGGTDCHLVLWDLRPRGIDGSRFERVCELCEITVNKNTCPGDKSAMNPGGCRLGTPALTSRGFNEKDMHTVTDFLNEAVEITKQAKSKTKTLKDFKEYVMTDAATLKSIADVRGRVEAFSSKFSMPGFENH